MAFAITGGQIESLYRPSATPFSAVQLGDNISVEYAEIWRRQPQVRTVVGFLARNIAQLGLHVFRRVSDVDRERVTDHPLAQLLSRPNPFTTPYRFVEAMVSDLAIFDNSIHLKVKAEGGPSVGVVRIDPQRVKPEGKNPFVAEGFKIGRQVFAPEDVIHCRGYSPIDARWGVSPMETLRAILAEDHQAAEFREALWRNGARVSGYLERPAAAPNWTDKGKERFRASWQAQYTAGGYGVGGTPILEDGMKYVPAATTPKDAQYIESRKLTREEVTAAYHIPLTLVGLLDNATYSNITEQHKIMYQDTLGPWLTMIQQELALQLLPDFPDAEDLYLEFNVQEKLRGNFEDQAEQIQTAVGGPWMTRNEGRARVNLPQIDGGDSLITPLNVSPGTGDPAAITPPADTAAAPRSVDRARLRAVEAD